MSGAGEDHCGIRSRSPCTLAPHAVATGDPVKAQRLPARRLGCTTHTISLTSAPRVREARVKKQHQHPPS